MKFLLWLLLLVSFLISCITPESKQNPFETIQQSYAGGGGYITGMIQDPNNPVIIYARCDVAGMFKSVDGGKNWRLINKGLKQAHNHNVESIAIHPLKSNVLLRGSGELRNSRVFGDIYKSTDGGENWYPVTDQIDFFGNGPNRQYGERIAFNPLKPEIVMAGGYRNGVFRSVDEGDSWQYCGLYGEPISCVAFHPVNGHCYVATICEVPHKNILDDGHQLQRPAVGRLFVSKDDGHNWTLIFEKAGLEFAELVFSKNDVNTITAACVKSGVLKSVDGGKNFMEIMNGLPRGLPYNTIAMDPNNEDRLFTAPKRKSFNKDVPLVPLYVSENAGNSWILIKEYSLEDFSKYPGYIRSEEYIGWSIARLMVDREDPNRLFMSNWYGVSVSADRGQSWCGNFYAGTETVCCENIVTDPLVMGKAYFVLPDHRPFFSVDGGKTFTQYNEESPFHNSTVLASSVHQPGLLLVGAKKDWRGYNGSAIIRSQDDGKSFQVVRVFENGLTVQAIREDLHTPGRFYAFIDRKIEDGAGIYYTNDYGSTWERMNMSLPDRVTQFPQRQMLVENEVLSIVWGQQKNGCGTNQLLCVDPFKENTLYLGEWTEGVFCTHDHGKTWLDISSGLPFFVDSTALLVSLAVDAHNPGVLYAGFLKNGLWKSANRGLSWEKIFPSEDEVFNASSIVVGNYAADELFVACEPLYWAPSESRIVYSKDGGYTWVDIYNNEYGALRWKAIAEDPYSGTVYGATAGNGVFRFVRK